MKKRGWRTYHFHQDLTSPGSSLPAAPAWPPGHSLQTQALKFHRQQKPMHASSPPLVTLPSPRPPHATLTWRVQCCTLPPPPPGGPWREEMPWWGRGTGQSKARTAPCCSSLRGVWDCFTSVILRWSSQTHSCDCSWWPKLLASPRAVSLMFSCCDSFSIGCSVLDHKTWVDRDNFRVQTKLLHHLDCLSVSSSLPFFFCSTLLSLLWFCRYDLRQRSSNLFFFLGKMFNFYLVCLEKKMALVVHGRPCVRLGVTGRPDWPCLQN